MAYKVCPILRVGNMLVSIGKQEVVTMGDQCIKDECEWFNNGCPAYPGNIVEYATAAEADEQKQVRTLATLIHRALEQCRL